MGIAESLGAVHTHTHTHKCLIKEQKRGDRHVTSD